MELRGQHASVLLKQCCTKRNSIQYETTMKMRMTIFVLGNVRNEMRSYDTQINVKLCKSL